MAVLGKRHRSSKKLRSNPYAERGLDKFALVSAELEAKRERLVAQLGTQLSLVRFAIGSDHRDWIPVIACPTLSKAEIRALKRTATRLITEDRAAITSSASAHQVRTPGVSVSESNMHHSSLTCYDHDDEEDAQNCAIGTLNCLLQVSERCLWMAAFTFSIAVDIVSNVFLSKWHAAEAPPKRILPSTREPKEKSDNPSSNMSSSMNFSSLPPIRAPPSISAKGIKVTTPSHTTAHGRAPKTHNRCVSRGFSTAPSTPRNSRQVTKSFQASVSLPPTTRLQDEAPRSGITKDSKFLKSVSLPKVSRLKDASSHVVLRNPGQQSMAKQSLQKKERKEQSEKLGQALTGAGLVLGLGGLVMGYVPAIVCVVCWWYMLPNLRMAVGDKPYVKSHHL